MRNLLVRYLDERRPGVDYGTFVGLTRELAGVFWADSKAHHPGAGNHKALAQTQARMHHRVRERLPHLGHLVEAAERERDETATLPAAAKGTQFDEYFDHEGTRYLRVLPADHKVTSRPDHVTPHVYIQAEGSTKRINRSMADDEAFWAWAVIETLRHTGVRVEELTEITHLTLVSYKLDPRQRSRLIEIIQNLRERIRESRGNGWLGEVEGLQVSVDAATKLNSLGRGVADGRPEPVDLGMPVFTDPAPPPPREPGEHEARA
ncbi:hypothetical protein ACFYOG_31925 [Streptomyces sp. NPDC007818]|uniref:hypothetical protein n=1 Tax=Streptomyces sp. NPDC007818 TaxID=3364780 RepID=UPI0036BD74E6